MTPPPENDPNAPDWKRRRQRRRQRLHKQFRQSRRPHEPPPDPEDWEPDPLWKYIAQTAWENPVILMLIAILIAIVLYILFPPASLAAF